MFQFGEEEVRAQTGFWTLFPVYYFLVTFFFFCLDVFLNCFTPFFFHHSPQFHSSFSLWSLLSFSLCFDRWIRENDWRAVNTVMAYWLMPIFHKPWVKMTQHGIFISRLHLFRRTDRSKERQELPVKSILSDAHVITTTTTRINPIPPIFSTPLPSVYRQLWQTIVIEIEILNSWSRTKNWLSLISDHILLSSFHSIAHSYVLKVIVGKLICPFLWLWEK